jgi:signal transduction histidine kinase
VDEKEKFYSDENRITIILSNLINNALRYGMKYRGAEKTKIDIKVSVNNEKALFSVSDNGPGISEEFHDKIFDMFYRKNESISGTGLGLYIVKESVERLQGKVSIESSLDQGANFLVDIPNGIGSVTS